jgi:L-lysine exporter family protein LysE/ArgO
VVVAICAAADVALIVAGVAGIGRIVERAPAALDVVRWLGVAFLTWYGVSSLMSPWLGAIAVRTRLRRGP